MKKIIAIALALLTLTSLCVFGVSAENGEELTQYRFFIESFLADGYTVAALGGAEDQKIVYDEPIVFHDSIVITGWMANPEENKTLEYSLDGGLTWIDTNVKFLKRGDLTSAGVPYSSSHSGAAFSATIYSDLFMADRTVSIDFRIGTKGDSYINFLTLSNVTYSVGEIEFKLEYRVSLDYVENGVRDVQGGPNTTATINAEINAGDTVYIRGWALSNCGIQYYEMRVDEGDWYSPGDNFRARGDILKGFPNFTAAQGNGGDIGFGTDAMPLALAGLDTLPAGEYNVTMRAVTYEDNVYFDVITIKLTVVGELPPVTTAAESETTAAPATSEEPAATSAEPATTTAAPATTTAAPATTTAAPADTTAAAEGGCGSFAVSAAVVIAAAAAAFVYRRKED